MKNPPGYKSFNSKATYFYNNQKIDSPDDLRKALSELKSKPGYIFRGIYDASYKLYSSVQREFYDIDKRKAGRSFDNLVNYYINGAYALKEIQDYMTKEAIHKNDFFIMALLQHFRSSSPLVDFTSSLNKSLFFCLDGVKNEHTHTHRLKDYVSLYYIDAQKIDWTAFSIQQLMEDSANKVDRLIENQKNSDPYFASTNSWYKDQLTVFEQLPFNDFYKNSPDFENEYAFSFIKVDAGSSKVDITIPSANNFKCSYIILNDRILRQDGLFFFANSKNKPLEDLIFNTINSEESGYQYKIIGCLNIHKSLLDIIRKEYQFDEKGEPITHSSVYGDDSTENQQLEKCLKPLWDNRDAEFDKRWKHHKK